MALISAPLRVGIVEFDNFGQFIMSDMQQQGHAVLAASRSDYSAYCTHHRFASSGV
jgi:arogenate dehydrogenase (NADP+)